VLNFWFIGCAVCRAHHPKLNELKGKFAGRDDVVFLAATYESEGDVKKYLSKEKFDYLQVADADPLLKTFRFAGYPRNIVVSRTGEIVYWRTSVSAWDKFESVIRNELAK
jgi:thiol-disulfide isomerase/thioredoxin